MKEGDHAQHVTPVTEIWKGRYNEREVALKLIRVHRDDPQAETVQSVSASRDSRTAVFSVMC